MRSSLSPYFRRPKTLFDTNAERTSKTRTSRRSQTRNWWLIVDSPYAIIRSMKKHSTTNGIRFANWKPNDKSSTLISFVGWRSISVKSSRHRFISRPYASSSSPFSGKTTGQRNRITLHEVSRERKQELAVVAFRSRFSRRVHARVYADLSTALMFDRSLSNVNYPVTARYRSSLIPELCDVEIEWEHRCHVILKRAK